MIGLLISPENHLPFKDTCLNNKWSVSIQWLRSVARINLHCYFILVMNLLWFVCYFVVNTQNAERMSIYSDHPNVIKENMKLIKSKLKVKNLSKIYRKYVTWILNTNIIRKNIARLILLSRWYLGVHANHLSRVAFDL